MKTIAVGSLFVLLAIVAGVTATSAFADHAKVDISIPKGSGTPGCEVTNECFIPFKATIDVGGEVTWANDDTSPHTVTAGNLDTDPDKVGVDIPNGFDSGMIMPGQSFSKKFDVAGEFPYFCMVHPWMKGVIVVQEEGAEDDHMSKSDDLMVTIMDSSVKGGTQIDLEFTQQHVNYDITAKQNGAVIFEEKGVHAMETSMSHMIDAVGSDKNPIEVEVVSLGIGAPGSEADWTGPTGVVATAKVVPEFGTIAMMVLAIAIISIVAVTAKSRVIPRL